MLTVQGSWEQDCIEPPAKMIGESLFVGVHLVYFIRLLVHRITNTRLDVTTPYPSCWVRSSSSTGALSSDCNIPLQRSCFNTALDMCVELRYLSDLLICSSGILHCVVASAALPLTLPNFFEFPNKE
ncbi:hypothetical protein GE21DRAFT_1106359 [Neurospora crassa]|nr:hypothetical protein GE21DRAFT_1106359 [Neurospora crassa]